MKKAEITLPLVETSVLPALLVETSEAAVVSGGVETPLVAPVLPVASTAAPARTTLTKGRFIIGISFDRTRGERAWIVTARRADEPMEVTREASGDSSQKAIKRIKALFGNFATGSVDQKEFDNDWRIVKATVPH